MSKNRAIISKTAVATFSSEPEVVTNNFIDDPDGVAAPTAYDLLVRMAEAMDLMFMELRVISFLLTQQSNPPLPDDLDRLRSDLN